MAFTMLALLLENSPQLTVERLTRELSASFPSGDGFSVTSDFVPLSEHKVVSLRYESWMARFDYEDGDDVLEDSRAIHDLLGPSSRDALCNADRRIRVVFGDDEDQKYINEVIFVLEFLESMQGVVLFDPQRGDVLSF